MTADHRATVNEIQRLLIGTQGDPIGPLNQRLREEAMHRAIRVDAIDRIVVQFHSSPVVVARIGEKDLSVGSSGNIVRRVVTLPLKAIGQHFDLTRADVGASDSPMTIVGGAEFISLASQKSALCIE